MALVTNDQPTPSPEEKLEDTPSLGLMVIGIFATPLLTLLMVYLSMQFSATFGNRTFIPDAPKSVERSASLGHSQKKAKSAKSSQKEHGSADHDAKAPAKKGHGEEFDGASLEGEGAHGGKKSGH